MLIFGPSLDLLFVEGVQKAFWLPLGRSPKASEVSFGSILEILPKFLLRFSESVQHVKKVIPRIVGRCETQSASIVKTCNPRSTSSENQQ